MNVNRQSNRREQGFTMLELIGTIAVLFVVAPAMFGLLATTQRQLGQGTDIVEASQAFQGAVEYGKVHLNDFFATRPADASVCWDGAQEVPSVHQYKADYRVCPQQLMGDATVDPGLYEVQVTVYEKADKSDAQSFSYLSVKEGF